MELILHIGISKTGTTAIQNFLYKNKEKLLEQGILYPSTGLFKSPNVAAHYNIAWSIFKHVGVDVNKIPTFEQILKNLEKELREYKPLKVIISSESFMHFRRPHIKTLAEGLKDLFQKMKVVVYLRRQDRWIESSYAQVLKTGEVKLLPFKTSIKHSLWNLKWLLNYDEFLDRWSEFFENQGQLLPRIYEKSALKDNDIVVDFISLVDNSIEITNFDTQINTNPSLIPISVFTLLKLNEEYDLPQVLYHKVSKYLLNLQEKLPHPLKTLLYLEDRKKILSFYEANNIEFFQKWFGSENLFKLNEKEIEIYREQDELLRDKDQLNKDIKERYELVINYLKQNFPEFEKYKKKNVLKVFHPANKYNVLGLVEVMNKEKITGWIIDEKKHEVQTVVLKVNNIKILERKATEKREELKEEYNTDKGGFTIYWKEIILPKELRNLSENTICKVELIHKESGKLIQGNYTSFTVKELKKITRLAKWMPWLKTTMPEEARDIIEYFHIDQLYIDVLNNGLVRIGGVVGLKKHLRKEDFELLLKTPKDILKARWDLPSPGYANANPKNPNAKKARFLLERVEPNYPLELFLKKGAALLPLVKILV